jgi:hypothetical protein
MITTVGELAKPDSNFFLRSEYRLASSWPALGFTKSGERDQIREQYRAGLDFIFWVGTSKEPTPHEFRSRLLSLVRIDTKVVRNTSDVVTEEVWRKAQRGSGQWLYSFEAVEVWDVQGYPEVRAFAPEAYELRGRKRGMLLSPVGSAERKALRGLELRRVELPQK